MTSSPCRGTPRRWVEREKSLQPKLVDRCTGQSRPICVDCGDSFEQSAEEIAARRGTGMPVSPRCPGCRMARREARNAVVEESLRSGALRETQPRSAGPGDGTERLYPADCSGCKRPIRLPFKPSLDRPIFCRFCLDARNGR